MSSIHDYWGKFDGVGFHPLDCHQLDVAACLSWLLRSVPRLRRIFEEEDFSRAADTLSFFAAIHDLGKLSPSFQHMRNDTSQIASELGVLPARVGYDGSEARHDVLGFKLYEMLLANEINRACVPSDRHPPSRSHRKTVNVLMNCFAGHHGKPPMTSKAFQINASRYFGDPELAAARAWIAWCADLFKPDVTVLRQIESRSHLIAGLITLADWLGSNQTYFGLLYPSMAAFRERAPFDASEYWAHAQVTAERCIAECLGEVLPSRTYPALFPKFGPTPVQKAVIDLMENASEQFLLVIEETTGGGKTEAALTAAGGSNLFFGLPTQATANGLWKRIAHLGGQQTLLHGNKWQIPAAMDRANDWLNDETRRGLLADLSVGTIDQAMIGVMHARYYTLRLAGLAGKTLIIDEVHAYDPYMKRIIETLITMHAKQGGSVVLLSATLPHAHRHSYLDAFKKGIGCDDPFIVPQKTDFPLITYLDDRGRLHERGGLLSRAVQTDGAQRTVEVSYLHKQNEVLARIQAHADGGRAVAWIRNSVAEAVEAAETLKREGYDVILFHSRFTTGDRRRIEEGVMAAFGPDSNETVRTVIRNGRETGKIVVATQVIEQSLDLDFDEMITDLCPIDLLIQRIGRLHRHARGDRGQPEISVYCPPWSDAPDKDWISAWSKNSGYVYPNHARLWLTVKALRNVGGVIRLPLQARQLIESVYSDEIDVIPPSLVENFAAQLGAEMTQTDIGSLSVLLPEKYYGEDFAPHQDEMRMSTRLGDRSQEWVLFNEDGPITKDIAHSSISLSVSQLYEVDAVHQPDKDIEAALGKYRKGAVFRNGVIKGTRLIGSKKVPVTIEYTSLLGLLRQ